MFKVKKDELGVVEDFYFLDNFTTSLQEDVLQNVLAHIFHRL